MEKPPSLLTSEEELLRHYGAPHPHVVRKQIDHLDVHARSLIAASPLMLLATVGPKGVDVSPKGDRPGFVKVLDDKTLLLPDRPGNRRLDGLKNIVADGRVGMIFLIPGVTETFRVNGRAVVSIDEGLRALCAQEGKKTLSVIQITVEEVFAHCGRALLAADLWNPAGLQPPADLPSARTVFEAHLALGGQ